MSRLQERNPRLVVLSTTGFGHDGPEGDRAGYDQIAQGEAGLRSLTGSSPEDPQWVGVPIADLLSGMYGAYGVLAALHERDRTGRARWCGPRCWLRWWACTASRERDGPSPASSGAPRATTRAEYNKYRISAGLRARCAAAHPATEAE